MGHVSRSKSTVKKATRIPVLHHCGAENRKSEVRHGKDTKNGDVRLACEKGEKKGEVRERRRGRNNGIPLLFPFPPPFSTPDVTRHHVEFWKKSKFALTPSAKLLFLQSQSSRQPFCYCPQSSMTTTALRTNMNKQLSPAQKIRLCYIPKHDARWVEERREAW